MSEQRKRAPAFLIAPSPGQRCLTCMLDPDHKGPCDMSQQNGGDTIGKNNEQRAAFLLGEGTLTLAQLHEWASELGAQPSTVSFAAGLGPDQPLMVSVLPSSIVPAIGQRLREATIYIASTGRDRAVTGWRSAADMIEREFGGGS